MLTLCKIWNAQKQNDCSCHKIYKFPEQPHVKSNLGIAFSGGGSRSFSASMGYMRALEKLQVTDNVDYISSVSGGSWFSSLYLYVDKPINELLGESIDINCINYKSLNEVNKDSEYYIGDCLTSLPIIDKMIEAKEGGIDDSFLWNYGIGKLFLEKYGLFNSTFTNRSEMLQDCNPSMSIVRQIRKPFWICNMSLLYPDSIKEGVTSVQSTSFYSGFQQIINNQIGGVWIENPGFGCKNPTFKNDDYYFVRSSYKQNTSLTEKSNIFTLENAIGTSSAAYAYATDLLSAITTDSGHTILENINKLNPVYNLWKPTSCECNEKSQTYQSEIGDGYVCDNTGILSLVSRGVKKIIAFDNNSFLDGTYANTGLPQLFGIFKSSEYHTVIPNIDSTQIFPSIYWKEVEEQFNNHPYCHIKLPVLENKQNGIEGGYEVEILVIILVPSIKFNSLIPKNISDTFSRDDGPFPLFPNYKTILANKGDIMGLTFEQVNLLSTFTEWTIMESNIKDIILSMIE